MHDLTIIAFDLLFTYIQCYPSKLLYFQWGKGVVVVACSILHMWWTCVICKINVFFVASSVYWLVMIRFLGTLGHKFWQIVYMATVFWKEMVLLLQKMAWRPLWAVVCRVFKSLTLYIHPSIISKCYLPSSSNSTCISILNTSHGSYLRAALIAATI